MVDVVALIHGKAGAYGISFPDFPGVASGGDTIADTLARGREALAFHVEGLFEEGIAVPAVRSFEAVSTDPEHAEAFGDAAIVAALEVDLPGRSKPYTISMDERLMGRIDARAKAAGESRSGFLAAAARRRLAEEA
ncbi:ribbon-helix-helix protein, CopG family [Aureimonas leprariae]|uniref:Ribbon-helix-helix protein, CopG family n=1 Tax=Plantimonas leprariae TaxID=2615207 RepID=A0A7V7TXS8_9HYPH|nr:type II toxin-antitoxin system HicB family antitoxin [Aureimonas leprariae]KAB0681321.1 ribbon-helix-helix protein, CopG family [Aureimonas leprariae]